VEDTSQVWVKLDLLVHIKVLKFGSLLILERLKTKNLDINKAHALHYSVNPVYIGKVLKNG